MMQRLLAALGIFCVAALGGAAEFENPVRLKAGGVEVRVESPGYDEENLPGSTFIIQIPLAK